MTAGQQGFGQFQLGDFSSEYNAIQFLINQTLLRVRTIIPVQVISSTNVGTVIPPGTVSVRPLINMLDGQGNATNHGTIYNVPVFRYGSGNGSIICDPVAGDVGLLAIADRDMSSMQVVQQNTPGVKDGAALVNPASFRLFDLADGIYLGSLFGKAPTQSITFTSTGMTITDMNGNKIVTGSTGMTIFDNNGNQIQLKAGGIVNIVGILQVGGVAITVP